jgi:methionyl-tRNA synthetase
VVEVEPWALAKRREEAEVEERLATTLYNLAEVLRITAECLQPFLPGTAEQLAARLRVELSSDSLLTAARWGTTAPGTVVERGEVMFPKLELPEDD